MVQTQSPKRVFDLDALELETKKLAQEFRARAFKGKPLEFAQQLVSLLGRCPISRQRLAKKMGIAPSTIHHYESLIRSLDPKLQDEVAAGKLCLKEGRVIADLKPHKRQREIAVPFVSGALSSIHVEKLVALAKECPSLDLSELQSARKGKGGGQKPEEGASQPKEEAVVQPTDIDLDVLREKAVELAGFLDALPLREVPEHERLRLSSALRLLESRLKPAMDLCNNNMR